MVEHQIELVKLIGEAIQTRLQVHKNGRSLFRLLRVHLIVFTAAFRGLSELLVLLDRVQICELEVIVPLRVSQLVKLDARIVGKFTNIVIHSLRASACFLEVFTTAATLVGLLLPGWLIGGQLLPIVVDTLSFRHVVEMSRFEWVGLLDRWLVRFI